MWIGEGDHPVVQNSLVHVTAQSDFLPFYRTTIKDLPIPLPFHQTIMSAPLAYCLALTLVLPLLLAHRPRFQQLRFGNVVTFGDSYTDMGNFYKLPIVVDSIMEP